MTNGPGTRVGMALFFLLAGTESLAAAAVILCAMAAATLWDWARGYIREPEEERRGRRKDPAPGKAVPGGFRLWGTPEDEGEEALWEKKENIRRGALESRRRMF